jgi:hypothetical protein
MYAPPVALAIVATLGIVLALTEWSTRADLTIIGVTLEIGGVLLVSMDFWFEWAVAFLRRGRHWSRERGRRAVAVAKARARALWTRLRRRRTVAADARVELRDAAVANATDSIATKVEKGESLAAMTRRLYEFEDRIGRVEARQEADARALDAQLAAVRADVQDLIRRSKDQYLGWRIVGLAVALVGACFLAAANLV